MKNRWTGVAWEARGKQARAQLGRWGLAAVLLVGGLVLSQARIPVIHAAPMTGVWSATGSLNQARSNYTATLLNNGQVLVTGGINSGGVILASAELYDPATNTWSATGSMSTARFNHTATLLTNGQVLVAGGENFSDGFLSSAELYDPSTRTWTATGSLNQARFNHTATLLTNGQVLVAGGKDSGHAIGGVLSSAELYDPATGVWTATGSMTTTRVYHTATLLNNGQVLVAGGEDNSNVALASAELYDPPTGVWTATGSLNQGRLVHTATLLTNGQVLVAGGGNNGVLGSAELYDPATGTWSATGSLNQARSNYTATLLNNGKVLVAGGTSNGSDFLSSAELYDPTTGTWSATGSMSTARLQHTATLLNNGKVLVAGGSDDFSGNALSSAELFTLVDGDLGLTGVPANITLNATSPQGALVSYTAPTATDEGGDNPAATVSCDHATGATFAIGVTTVTCTASDSDDSNSPVSASFTVTVVGASGQVSALLATVNGYSNPALPKTQKTPLDNKLQLILAEIASNQQVLACTNLTGVIGYVKAQTGIGGLTAARASALIAATKNIQATLGC
jgi:N-acetylneuraminic acid mutarotase